MTMNELEGEINLVILGEPFLKKFYTIYDVEARKIGIAPAIHKWFSWKFWKISKISKKIFPTENPSN